MPNTVLRFIAVIGLMLVVGLLVSAQDDGSSPDYEATATAIIREATRNAGTPNSGGSGGAVPVNEFSMTATALVGNVTGTARASGVETQVPSTQALNAQMIEMTATSLMLTATAIASPDGVTPISESQFQATVTALVAEATAVAGGSTPDVPPAEEEALPTTTLFAGVITAFLALIGGAIMFFTGKKDQ